MSQFLRLRDRYLVGKLAPREAAQGGIEGLDGPLANEDAEEPTDATAPGRHEPGAEFGTATGRVEPESDSADEIDAASNQSLVPSSLGMTFCVDGDADRIEIEACWGRYERLSELNRQRYQEEVEQGLHSDSKARTSLPSKRGRRSNVSSDSSMADLFAGDNA